VLPFCLTSRRLALPRDAAFAEVFTDSDSAEAAEAELSAVG